MTNVEPAPVGPGIYGQIREDDYHADRVTAPELGPTLSSSGAKALLDCPARYRHNLDRPPTKRVWDKGAIAHALILRNPDHRIRIADTRDWRQRAWQTWRDDTYSQGLVPIHRGDLATASHIAAAVRRHPIASKVLTGGDAEQSIYWIDPATGIACRGRIDYLRPDLIIDVKTIVRADETTITRQSANFGYAQQAEWYQRGIEALTGQKVPFVHVFVESDAPHLVHVAQLSDDFLAYGRDRNNEALALFAHCQRTGEWPGYGDAEITLIHPPYWL